MMCLESVTCITAVQSVVLLFVLLLNNPPSVWFFFFFQMVETFLFVMVLYCLNNVDLAVHVPQHQHTSQIVFQLTEF